MTGDPEHKPFQGLAERDKPPEKTLVGRWYDAFDSVRFRKSLSRIFFGMVCILWGALDWGGVPRWVMLTAGISGLVYAVPALIQEWEKPGPDE